MTIPEIKVFPTPPLVAEEAANRIMAQAAEFMALQERFSIVLSGGSTPKTLYELLASPAYRDQIDWTRVHVYFGDERCVPPDHPDSNYRMASEALLSHVPIPGDNVYRMRGEIDPEAAATEYGQLLKERFGDAGPDLVLLGMGDDGHTLSLFPGTTALQETRHRCVSNFVQKLNVWRITLTAPFVNRAAQILVLVAGAGKASRVQEVLEGEKAPQRNPIQLIDPASGRITWLLDAEAAAME
jgi:6-phosphogluconolactonase